MMNERNVRNGAWVPFFFACLLAGLSACSAGRSRQSAQSTGGKEILVSGTVRSADDKAPLMGVVAIETGRLYSKKYRYGGLIHEDGHFSVKVFTRGSHGLHIYATGHVYKPVGIEVKRGEANRFEFAVPPNAASRNAPIISDVHFERDAKNPGIMIITLSVEDPNGNLSHQVLGINKKTQEALLFSPPKLVFPWTRNYPNGIYTLTYRTGGRPFAQEEWLFVAADNRCYTSRILKAPFSEQAVLAARPAKMQGLSATPSARPGAGTLDEAALIKLGRKTFMNNCSICHYPDKEKTKVGPGLKGLFKRPLTPVMKVPVTEEYLRNRIQNGGEHMPPYSHIREPARTALIAYLKTL